MYEIAKFDEITLLEGYNIYCNKCYRKNKNPITFDDYRLKLNIYNEEELELEKEQQKQKENEEKKRKIKKGIAIGLGAAATIGGAALIGHGFKKGIKKYKQSNFHKADTSEKGEMVGKGIGTAGIKTGEAIGKGIGTAGKFTGGFFKGIGKSVSGLGKGIKQGFKDSIKEDKKIEENFKEIAYQKAYHDEFILHENYIPNEIYFEKLLFQLEENYDIEINNFDKIYLYDVFNEAYYELYNN